MPDQETIIRLWVRAGGRCEFPGCNKYLLDDEFTGIQYINLADKAHIVARSPKGPRGDVQFPKDKLDDLENLMLLCSEHHNKIIDKGKLVPQFPPELLAQYKKEHEQRVYYLTSLQPGQETTIIRMRGSIRGHSVEIPIEQIRKAVLENASRYPRYPMGKEDVEIDLTHLPEDTESYWDAGIEIIRNKIQKFYKPGIESGAINHVTVFALARIPFLIYLGTQLSNKIPTDIYQKHRNGEEGWVWDENAPTIKFKINKLHEGNSDRVALILSLSGKIHIKELPDNIADHFSVSEIEPKNQSPNLNVLRSKYSLEEFRSTYHEFLSHLEETHKGVDTIHIFPAVPSPVAVICGRDIIKEVMPSISLYERVNGKYKFIIKVE